MRFLLRSLTRIALTTCITAILLLVAGCKPLFVGKGYPKYTGTYRNLPVDHQVEILRDHHGVPHIYAENKHDLMVAQGFVHAQDRLWQMETLRRLAAGRLAEVAGEKRLNLDYFSRVLGFAEMRRRASRQLRNDEIALLQAYVDGVNSYIHLKGGDLPLEFHSAGLKPEDWTVEDVCSFFAVTAWMFRENYQAELMELAARKTVELSEWKDIFPSYPGADIPDEPYFQTIRTMKLGPVDRAALAFFEQLPEPAASGGGTNLWAIAHGPGGKPLLANDTHMGISVPGTWYLCHLNAPGVNIIGASAPGVPGVLIGHTDTVAWGFSVFPADTVDLFVVRVDPKDPTRYFVGDRTLTMDRVAYDIGLPKGSSRRFISYRTIYGPVITGLAPGVEGAVALHWYGTVPESDLKDFSLRAVLGFMDCKTAKDVVESGRNGKYTLFNLVAADTEGGIAWHSLGAVPVRKGYSGRLPADGSSGTMGWAGFVPYDQMPGEIDPPSGVIVNTNSRVGSDTGPYPIRGSWSAPYRYERVMALLHGLPNPSVDDFQKMQMDAYSLQAVKLLPRILSYQYKDNQARAAARILKDWDYQVRAGSQGAAVFEVFLTEWVRALLGDEIGPDLFYYFHIPFKKYLIQDVLLDRPDSTLWDRKDTPEKESPQQILEMALSDTMRWLEKKLGSDSRTWSWGRLHQITWRHPGATSSLTAMLLNSGPFPADGDCNTLNANAPMPALDDYRPFIIPTLRMVIPLQDMDAMRILAPMGQSGQPGHQHYDDMVGRWLAGELVNLPSSRARVQTMAAAEMVLQP